MTAVAEQIGHWLEQFTRQEPAEPWLQKLRESAFARFTELGFPTTRDEEWRFTNVAPIARANFVGQAPGLAGQIAVADLREADREHLGKYAGQSAFVALNTAFLKKVAFTRVARGAIIERPIEINHLATGQAGGLLHAHPRTLIVVAPGAQCTIVETYKGEGNYFTNAVTEIVAGEGAVVDHYKIQRESPEAFHVATMQVALGRSANFTTHNISLGGALVRNDIGVTLSEGAEATVNGLYLVNGTEHVDNHTVIDHAKPHGTSHELYKGILDGHSSAVFNGRIIVRKDAQKTDSKQTNKNLVLSDDAVIDTKPELQILADDVRCTHGATIGQLDAEALFYMQSRGIGKAQARSLLTRAFAQDIIDRIKIPVLRAQLEKVLSEKFHERSND
ncbi:MAG: Fe-S cluster assembly protein SufD [Bryobacteraceae bacterium]|jgi:Fe-S cluster assembly protein SufD